MTQDSSTSFKFSIVVRYGFMAMQLHEGYTERHNARLWDSHIKDAHDKFRESDGGLYTQITEWVRKHGFNDTTCLIDVCCGQGVTSDLISKTSGSRVTGVDISMPLIILSKQYCRDNPKLDFKVGNAADLKGFDDGQFDAATMINGIFHLPTELMLMALRELARVSKKNILITNVNPLAYEFFASAFQNQTRWVENVPGLEQTTIVSGNPEIAGPDNSRIVLNNTPFVMHPEKNLLRAITNAGLELTGYSTFGPVSLVGGPPGLDLFAKIELDHKDRQI